MATLFKTRSRVFRCRSRVGCSVECCMVSRYPSRHSGAGKRSNKGWTRPLSTDKRSRKETRRDATYYGRKKIGSPKPIRQGPAVSRSPYNMFSGAQNPLRTAYLHAYVRAYLFPVLDPPLGRLVRVSPLRHPPVVLRQLRLEVVVEAEGDGVVLILDLVNLAQGLPGARPPAKGAATVTRFEAAACVGCVVSCEYVSHALDRARFTVTFWHAPNTNQAHARGLANRYK